MAESYPNGWKTLWEKGEIARYGQFLFFPQCFQNAYFPGVLLCGPIPTQITPDAPGKQAYRKHCGKRRYCS